MIHQPMISGGDEKSASRWYLDVAVSLAMRGLLILAFMFVALAVFSADKILEYLPRYADSAVLVFAVAQLAKIGFFHVRSVSELMGTDVQNLQGKITLKERRAALLTEYKLLDADPVSRAAVEHIDMPYLASRAIDVVADAGARDDIMKTMNEIYKLQVDRLGTPLARLWMFRQSASLITYFIVQKFGAAVRSIVKFA